MVANIKQIFSPGAAQGRILRAGASTQAEVATGWAIDSSEHLLATTDNMYDIGAAGATRPRSIYARTSVIAQGASNALTLADGALTQSAGGLAITSTSGTLALSATGSNIVTLSTASSERLRVNGAGTTIIGNDAVGVALTPMNLTNMGLVIGRNSGANMALTSAAGSSIASFYHSQGTIASPTVTADTNGLGYIYWNGYTSAGHENAAYIAVVANTTYAGTGTATARMSFATANAGGMNVVVEHMRLTSTGQVLIGSSMVGVTPSALHVQQVGANATVVSSLWAAGTGVTPIYSFRNARGTLASPTATQSGDSIGQLEFTGRGTSGYLGGVYINATATATFGATATARLGFQTVDAGVGAERWWITAPGKLEGQTSGSQISWTTGIAPSAHILGPSDAALLIAAAAGRTIQLYAAANGSGAGGQAWLFGGDGSTTGGDLVIYAGTGAAGVGGDTIIDAGSGSTTDGVLYLGTSGGFNSAIEIGQAGIDTLLRGGLAIGGASAPIDGQFKWHTGLGAITQILGPTDQAFLIRGGGTNPVYVESAAAVAGTAPELYIRAGAGSAGAHAGTLYASGGTATGGGNGGQSWMFGGDGVTGGDVVILAGEGTATAGSTIIDAGAGPGAADGTLYLGTSAGYTGAVTIGQAAITTTVVGMLVAPATQIGATALGADHILRVEGDATREDITLTAGAGGLINLAAGSNGIWLDDNELYMEHGTKIELNGPTTVTGTTLFDGRYQGQQGADVASGTDITLGTGNYFDVTGTTAIHRIAAAGWRAGSVVTLQFDASVTVTHDSGTGTEARIFLEGAANFSATADDTLTLVYDGTRWREIARAVI